MTSEEQSLIDTTDGYEHIGLVFKSSRETRKLKLPEVSKELMIRRFYLQAIEEGRFSELPAQVYATGFIKNYAGFLGIDPKEAVRRFMKEAYGSSNDNQTELHFPDPIDTNILPDRKAIWGAAAAVLIIISSLFIFTGGSDEAPLETNQATAEVSETTETEVSEDAIAQETNTADNLAEDTTQIVVTTNGETTTNTIEETVTEIQEEVVETIEEPAVEAAPAPVQAASEPETRNEFVNKSRINTRVMVEALEPSWVEIKAGNGDIYLSRVLKKGQKYNVPQEPGMQLTTGNAGGVQVYVDGSPLPLLGAKGTVIRNVSLSANQLRTRSPR